MARGALLGLVTRAARDRMLTGREYNEVLKLPEIEAWEKKYLA